MKNIKFLMLVALMITFLSCDSDEQDVSPIVSTDNYPLATFVVSETNISESGGTLVTVDITFDKMIDRGVTFSGTQVGGTAVEHEDFEIHSAIVQPYSTSAQLIIEILEDATPEDTETLEIQIDRPSLANAYLINPDSQLPKVSINIENFESENLNMIFDWERGIDLFGTTYPTCGNVDLDIFAFDGDGNFVGWVAATGDCPETLTLTPADYPDGKYIFYHDLWSNGFAGYGTNTLVPITTTIEQPGVFSDSAVQDDSQAMNSDMFGADDTPSVGHNGFVVTIIVSNGTYTIDTSNPASKATIDKLKSMPRPNK